MPTFSYSQLPIKLIAKLKSFWLYRLCYANVAADTNSGYAAPSDSVTWFARNRSRKLLRFGRSIHPRSLLP